jgi:hypothetical protein
VKTLGEGLRLVKSSGPMPAKSAFIRGEATGRLDGLLIDLALAADPPITVGILLVIGLPVVVIWRVRASVAVPPTMIPASHERGVTRSTESTSAPQMAMTGMAA